MFAFVLAVGVLNHATPVEYVLDCSSWAGKMRSEVELDLTTADGKTFSFDMELLDGATPESVRDTVAAALTDRWHFQTVGKDVLVIHGSKTSPIRSVKVNGQSWVPVVTRRLAIPPQQEKDKK